MKKSKLITILISLLAFSILASAFVTGALGSDENGETTPYDAMIRLGYIEDLGRNTTVTRIDAIMALLSVTGEEMNASAFEGENGFYDNDSDLSSYIAYAAERGITLGDGNGFFSPSRPVILKEMLIMSLRALGYADVDLNNAYELAEDAGLYTYTEQDELYYYLNAERMAEILWNMLGTAPIGGDATYAELLTELGLLDGPLYDELTATVNYVFGDTTNARTAAYAETETAHDTVPPETIKPTETTSAPNTDDNEGWSDLWKP